jgi:hypothetical protein
VAISIRAQGRWRNIPRRASLPGATRPSPDHPAPALAGHEKHRWSQWSCRTCLGAKAHSSFPPTAVEDFYDYDHRTAFSRGALQLSPDLLPNSLAHLGRKRDVFCCNTSLTHFNRFELSVERREWESKRLGGGLDIAEAGCFKQTVESRRVT